MIKTDSLPACQLLYNYCMKRQGIGAVINHDLFSVHRAQVHFQKRADHPPSLLAEEKHGIWDQPCARLLALTGLLQTLK